jgi:hypothetical protein
MCMARQYFLGKAVEDIGKALGWLWLRQVGKKIQVRSLDYGAK